jgi:hypothetical protein
MTAAIDVIGHGHDLAVKAGLTKPFDLNELSAAVTDYAL